jgi:hypothetical protein
MLHVPVPETAVPVPQPAPTERRKLDSVRLDSAIADAKGDALLLGLAVDDAFQVENEALVDDGSACSARLQAPHAHG